MKKILFFLFFIFFLSSTFAHLDAGEDKVVGSYLVDFGYAPKNPVTNSSSILSFNLADNATQLPIDFDYVWVRISSPEKVEFAGNIAPENKNAAFSYTFNQGGTIGIDAKFVKAGQTLAEASFSVPVQPSEQNQTLVFTILGFAGIAIMFFGAGFAAKSFFKKSN